MKKYKKVKLVLTIEVPFFDTKGVSKVSEIIIRDVGVLWGIN